MRAHPSTFSRIKFCPEKNIIGLIGAISQEFRFQEELERIPIATSCLQTIDVSTDLLKQPNSHLVCIRHTSESSIVVACFMRSERYSVSSVLTYEGAKM